MSNKKQQITPTQEDLEDTAELPCLPAAESATDTWVTPQFAGVPALDEVIRAHQEELGSLRSNLASVTESRGQLEVSLSGLTTNLRELEQRLHSKSEQHSRYEREVGTRDRRIADLEKDLAMRVEQASLAGAERDDLRLRLERTQTELGHLTQLRERQAAVQAEVERDRGRRELALVRTQADLAETQRRIAGHNEALQHAEGQRQVFDSMLREREQLLDERDAGLSALQREFDLHKRDAGATHAQLTVELGGAQRRAAETQKMLAQAREELTAQSASALQACAALEAQLATHREQHQALEQRLAQQLQQSQARQQELTATGTLAANRVTELEALLIQAQQESRVAQGMELESQSRLAALQGEAADHGEAVRTLHEQLRLAQTTNETLHGDLAAAEDLIRTSESELQQREARLARLESNELALRSKLEAVGRSLDERNALIARLEGEAASSAAVLGSIQHNLERLDHEAAGRHGNSGNFSRSGDFSSTGNHSQTGASGSRPAPGGHSQLLVRTDGDSGIVHVLGRRTTIGRTPDNDLRIDADFISRHHAVVLITSSGTIVEDLASTNGVFVNNTRVTRRQLNAGDVVTIGKTGFRFVIKPAAEAS